MASRTKDTDATVQRFHERTAENARGMTSRSHIVAGRACALIFTICMSLGVGCVAGSAKTIVTSTTWKAVRYPIECGKGVELRVLQVRRIRPALGAPRMLALVQCQLEDGTGHAALFLYENPRNPRLVQELVHPKDSLFPRRQLTIKSNRVIALPIFAYSSAVVPRARPDVLFTLVWRWHDGSFHLVTKPPHHATGI
jgi:hypothetical protein